MDEFPKQLGNITWWIALAIGFILSIIANYATKWTERGFSRYSKNRKEAKVSRQAYIDKLVNDFTANPAKLTDLKDDIILHQTRAALFATTYIFIVQSFGLSNGDKDVLGAIFYLVITILAPFYIWPNFWQAFYDYRQIKIYKKELENRVKEKTAIVGQLEKERAKLLIEQAELHNKLRNNNKVD